MTLHLEIRFLTDAYVATDFTDRRRGEWPPHPARVYSALVAALHDGDGVDPEERDALTWLETQPPPDVLASAASPRTVFTTYVPVNDETVLGNRLDAKLETLEQAEADLDAAGDDPKARKRAAKALDKARAAVRVTSEKEAADDGKGDVERAASLLPDGRSKAARTFPVMVPEAPRVVLRWPEPAPDAILPRLDAVCARVSRLGHSRSLVSVRAVSDVPDLDGLTPLVPNPQGTVALRLPEAGQLDRLDALHAQQGAVGPRTMPARVVPYGPPRPADPPVRPGTVFADGAWILWRVVAGDHGPRTLVHHTLAETLGRTLKKALLAHAGADAPPLLTGHRGDGGVLEVPHAAFLTLPDVGHEHATGAVLGMALQLPAGVSDDDLAGLGAALRAWERDRRGCRLLLGRGGVVHLERLVEPDGRAVFRRPRWAGPARRWASVTPVALDRNPGDLRSRDPDEIDEAVAKAETSIRRACLDVGLPEPVAVNVQKRSSHVPGEAARRFMPFPAARGHGLQRVCVHAELVFDGPVRGPLLLGAGRYVGVGLFLPAGGAP